MSIVHTNQRWKPKKKSQRNKMFDNELLEQQRRAKLSLYAEPKEYVTPLPSDHRPRIPSAPMLPPEPPRMTKRLEGDMLERENIAQKEIAKKKKQVGVLYNKGAMQYITPGTDLTTLGKK